MVKHWDDRMKRIFGEAPQDLVSWLMPGARFIERVPLELKTLTRTVNSDTLYKVIVNGKKAILHIEFQKKSVPNMVKRVWEYNVLATLEHDCPVYSFIIYLTPSGKIRDPPLEWGLPGFPKAHNFHFTNIKLWELSVEGLRKTGLVGLLPLGILAKGGKKREVAEEIFSDLEVAKEGNLLSLALTLASIVFKTEADQEWIRRKIAMLEDIVRDTWLYKELMQRGIKEGLFQGLEKGLAEGRAEGLEKGLAEGRAEGLEKGLAEGRAEGHAEGRSEGMLKALRLSALDIIRERFPDLEELAKQQIERVQNATALRRLIVRISTAKSAQKVEQYLRKLNKNLDQPPSTEV